MEKKTDETLFEISRTHNTTLAQVNSANITQIHSAHHLNNPQFSTHTGTTRIHKDIQVRNLFMGY